MFLRTIALILWYIWHDINRTSLKSHGVMPDRCAFMIAVLNDHIDSFSFQTPQKSGLTSDSLVKWQHDIITWYSIKKNGFLLKTLKIHDYITFNTVNMGNNPNLSVNGLTFPISVLHSAGPCGFKSALFLRRLWKMSGNSDPGRIVYHLFKAQFWVIACGYRIL